MADATELSQYELQRLNNLKENEAILKALGIYEDTGHLAEYVRSKKQEEKPFKRKISTPTEPVRRSSRIGKIAAPNYAELNSSSKEFTKILPKNVTEHNESPIQLRKSSDDISLQSSYLLGDSYNSTYDYVQKICSDINVDPGHVIPLSCFRNANWSIQARHFRKVTQGKIYSLDYFPSKERRVLAVGDKYGHVALWDMDNNSTFVFRPHASNSVRCVRFADPNRGGALFSSSDDGTIRRLVVDRGVFDELYRTNDDGFTSSDGANALTCLDFISDDVIIASVENGDVVRVDMRDKASSEQFELHRTKVCTVSVHPADSNIFVTASMDTTVCVWDVRNLNARSSKALASFTSHSKKVNSAYFSPLTGGRVLTTSLDNTLNVLRYDSTGLKQAQSLPHNNTTGRWLAPFRAAWHPACEDMFACGSMHSGTRQLDLFQAGQKGKFQNSTALRDENLTSICSIVAFRPFAPFELAGGNSSGRVFVFSGESQ